VLSSLLVTAGYLAWIFGGSRALGPARKQVDSGTFAITIAGQRAGRETFELIEVGPTFEIRTRTDVTLPAGATTIRGTLRTDHSFRPTSGLFDTTVKGETTRATLQRNGASLELMTKIPGRPAVSFTRPPKAPDLYLGANIVAHLTPLCREVGQKERSLTAFPAAPLEIAPVAVRKYPLTKLGAPEMELADVVVELARSVRIEVLCDGAELVAVRHYNQRLTAVRSSYEELASILEGRARGKPILPEALVELPRKIPAGGGGGVLGCTLLLPKTHASMKRGGGGKISLATTAPAAATPGPGGLVVTPAPPRPLPGVVLIGAFGPQDRDDNSVGPGDFHIYLFAALAKRLGEAGVASLRCDDRGTGQSSGDFKRATLDTFAADAEAALRALRAEPAVDPARTGLVGHSEGAMIASMIARRDARVRAVALLAPPARPLDAIILDEELASMRRFGLPEDEIAARLAELQVTYDAVRAGKLLPASLSSAERRAVQGSSGWLRSHFRHAPLDDAGQLAAVPAFVVRGGKDVQTSPRDVEMTRDALLKAGNHAVVYKAYPELNHLFAVSKTGSVADYYDPMAEVDAAFLDDVAVFFTTSLAPSTPKTK
jgi:pimeloyl-ACP methyl ester carboxylesterase